jgi:hypothetical protein
MRQLVDTEETLEQSAATLNELLGRHSEWLYSYNRGRESSPLRGDEFEVRIDRGRMIFSCWGDAGARNWRVVGWEQSDEKLILEVERHFGSEAGEVELIPRASAALIDIAVSEARLERCLALAKLAASQVFRSKIERAKLSPGSRPGMPGRYARIVLTDNRERIAVTGIVAETNKGDVDSLIAQSLLWYLRARQTVRGPVVRSLWLIVGKQYISAAHRRVVLLTDDLRSSIVIWEIDEEWTSLTLSPQVELSTLLAEDPPRLRVAAYEVPAAAGQYILELAPQSIDRTRARHGETLRFNGLPFARVRTLMGTENVWFGVDRSARKRLAPETERDWDSMYADLALNRHANQPDKRHALYRALPEAWLESILRRDITRLDPGLVISPIHAQFRTGDAKVSGSRPIDLLALREDGRLAVIELKVAEDLVLTLQGADYWLRVETHRRKGNIARARLFGDRKIADEPPIVYLVCPTLRFHRAFSTLASCIRKEIEIYRFDINEDWRSGVRVMRRSEIQIK